MSKLPAFQFYPADWRKDIGVQSLSYHDRGVWLEILCLMHESEERGKLILNGQPMSIESLSRVLGLDKQRLEQTLENLLSCGVASRDENGVLLNRRMVKDEHIRQIRKEAGSAGGNPKLTTGYNKQGYVYLIRRPSDNAVKIGVAANPQNRLYKLRHLQKDKTLFLEDSWLVEDMGKIEEDLHIKFAKWKKQGEWFVLPSEEIEKLIFLMEDYKEDLKSSISSNNQNSTPSVTSSSSNKKTTEAVVEKKPASPANKTSDKEKRLDDLQVKYPKIDVRKVRKKYLEYCKKTGNEANWRIFEYWLENEGEPMEIEDISTNTYHEDRRTAIENCSVCDNYGYIKIGDGVKICKHKEGKT